MTASFLSVGTTLYLSLFFIKCTVITSCITSYIFIEWAQFNTTPWLQFGVQKAPQVNPQIGMGVLIPRVTGVMAQRRGYAVLMLRCRDGTHILSHDQGVRSKVYTNQAHTAYYSSGLLPLISLGITPLPPKSRLAPFALLSKCLTAHKEKLDRESVTFFQS